MSETRHRAPVRRPLGGLTVLAVCAGLAFSVQAGMAAAKVRAQGSPTFDFTQAHTWAWNPESRGQVLLARTAGDDPEVVRQRAEPVIFQVVAAELPGRGLTAATAKPDLTATYYLLLSYGSAAQTMGQFLPSTLQWGLPFFAPSTQSLEVVEQGSLVLDLSSSGEVVWRGIGEAKLDMGLPQAKREALLRQTVKDILKSYPPKKK